MSGWAGIAITAASMMMAASCSASPEADMGNKAIDVGLCTFEVQQAEAWVNRMPGPATGKNPQMIVTVRITPAEHTLALEQDRFEQGTLYLTVAQGEAPLRPGVLSWRMYLPDEPLQRIVISCNGVVKAEIDEIGSAY